MFDGCRASPAGVGQVAISATRDAAAAPPRIQCIALLIRRRQTAVWALFTTTGIVRVGFAVLFYGIGLCIQPGDFQGSFGGQARAKSEGFLKGKGTWALGKSCWSKCQCGSHQ